MGIFTRELLRNFGIGFAIGTLGVAAIIGGMSGSGLTSNLVPRAIAAPMH